MVTYQELKSRKGYLQNHKRPEDVHCHVKETLGHYSILIVSTEAMTLGL